MSKILVDSGEYFKLKNRINELLETNKKLKEKYVYLEKKFGIEEDVPSLKKKIEQLNTKQNELNKKLSDIQKDNDSLQNANKELTNTKDNIEKQNIELKQMVEELEGIVKKQQKTKEGISICLTAWQTQNYIEECLDSIEAQTYFEDFNDYEILLGIDACQETLEKVKKIQYKYRNLRVFMMNKNVGTYVTSNTVMSKAKYDWFLRFDTDDVMFPNMVEVLMKNKQDADFVRFNMQNFPKDNKLGYKEFVQAEGQMLFSRQVFETYGGYQNWLCGADSEFITRLKNRIKFIKINEVLFKRRVHDNGLTSRKDTSLTSGIREKYKNYIKDHSRFVSVIPTVTTECTELPSYKVYVNFTTYPKRESAAVKMLTHFKKQLIKPDKIICWLAVDEYGGKNIPNSLKPFVKEGFIEVRWTRENLYGFKRYSIFKENTDYIYNIFIDDDILYDVNLVKDLYKSARKFKDKVICYCGYAFDYVNTEVSIKDIKENVPEYNNAYLSGFSCIPPKVFPIEMFEYERQRKQINPKSDDDWICAWLLKYKIPIILLHSRKYYNWVTISGTRENGIFTTYNSKTVDGVRNRIANFAKSCVFCGVEDKVKKLWPDFDIEKSCQGKYESIKKIQIK